MSNESSRVQSGLTKQVDDVLTADTDWITLANELDVSRYTLRDAHPEWSSSLPFRPMFLAYLWATVERESLSGIPERLSDRPELARAFGFEMDDLPQKVAVNQSGLKADSESYRRSSNQVLKRSACSRLNEAHQSGMIFSKQRTTKTNSRCQIEPSNACYGRRGIRCLMS